MPWYECLALIARGGRPRLRALGCAHPIFKPHAGCAPRWLPTAHPGTERPALAPRRPSSIADPHGVANSCRTGLGRTRRASPEAAATRSTSPRYPNAQRAASAGKRKRISSIPSKSRSRCRAPTPSVPSTRTRQRNAPSCANIRMFRIPCSRSARGLPNRRLGTSPKDGDCLEGAEPVRSLASVARRCVVRLRCCPAARRCGA